MKPRSIRHGFGNNPFTFKASFHGQPTITDIAAAQRDCGFDPSVFGKPSSVTTKNVKKGLVEASWNCRGPVN